MSFVEQIKRDSKEIENKLCEMKDILYSHSHKAGKPDLLVEVEKLLKFISLFFYTTFLII